MENKEIAAGLTWIYNLCLFYFVSSKVAFAVKFGISDKPFYSAVIRINCQRELLYIGFRDLLETTISYQSRDSNLLSNFVHLQNTLSVKLIRSLETYYLPSMQLILEVSMFSVKCVIFAFKLSCDSFLKFSFFFFYIKIERCSTG